MNTTPTSSFASSTRSSNRCPPRQSTTPGWRSCFPRRRGRRSCARRCSRPRRTFFCTCIRPGGTRSRSTSSGLRIGITSRRTTRAATCPRKKGRMGRRGPSTCAISRSSGRCRGGKDPRSTSSRGTSTLARTRCSRRATCGTSPSCGTRCTARSPTTTTSKPHLPHHRQPTRRPTPAPPPPPPPPTATPNIPPSNAPTPTSTHASSTTSSTPSATT
mmetsp:Transcript_29083/g.73089  ORF Transcript_29083/g.73089 Transcript_29083/m.73089 type:complete len:216 (-) Transcript_29083:85-732(-)